MLATMLPDLDELLAHGPGDPVDLLGHVAAGEDVGLGGPGELFPDIAAGDMLAHVAIGEDVGLGGLLAHVAAADVPDADSGDLLADMGANGDGGLALPFEAPRFMNRRGAEWMALMRARREVMQEQSRSSAAADQYGRLSQGWKRLMLRRGDHARSTGDQLPSHPNVYSTAGWVRMGWRHIGSRDLRPRGRVDVQSTHMGQMCLTTLASIAGKVQADAMSECITDELSAAIVYGRMLERGYDATPVLMRFGSLQAELEPSARFLVHVPASPGHLQRWKAVPLAEYRRLHPRGATDSGIMELWASWFELHWQTLDLQGHLVTHTRKYMTRPLILERGNASTTHEALERVAPEFATDALNAFTEQLQNWFLVHESVDSCPANARMQFFMAAKYNEWVLSCRLPCLGHKLHGAVSRSTEEEKLIGDVHAVHFVQSIASRRRETHRGLTKLIDDELLLVPGVLPDPAFAVRSLMILRQTVLRFEEHVRADCSGSKTGSKEVLDQVAQDLVRFLPGDWRVAKLLVYPDLLLPATYTRKEICDFVRSAFIQLGIFGGRHRAQPAKSRWGTCNARLGEVVAGYACCRVAPRTFRATWPDAWTSVNRGADEHADFHTIVRSKIYRMCKFTGSTEKMVFGAAVCVCATPIDHCLQRVQQESSDGKFLFRMLHARTNPFHEAQVAYGSMMLKPVAETMCGWLYWLFVDSGVTTFEGLSTTLRSLGLQMSSSIAMFCEWELDRYPWLFALFVDEAATPEEQRAAMQTFLHTFFCCLDPHCGQKVRRKRHTVQEISEDTVLLSCLRLMCLSARVENMVTERLLALMRHAYGGKGATAERIVTTSFMRQWLVQHEAAGGEDPRMTTRQQLARLQVPLQCLEPEKRLPQRRRARLQFANQMQTQYATMKDACAAFDDLPVEEQEAWRVPVHDACDATDDAGVDAATRYDLALGQGLWGKSSVDQPLRHDVVDAAVAACKRPARYQGREIGITRALQGLRTAFVSSSFVRDAEAIRQKQKVRYNKSCAEKHAGLCSKRDSAFWTLLDTATSQLDALMLQGDARAVAIGTFCCVEGTWSDSQVRETFHLLANRRLAKPRCTLWANCALHGSNDERCVTLEGDSGRPFYKTGGVVLQRFFACPHQGGQLERLDLCTMRVVSSEDPAQFKLGGALWTAKDFIKVYNIWDRNQRLGTVLGEATRGAASVGEVPEPGLLDSLRAGFSLVGGVGDASEAPTRPSRRRRLMGEDSEEEEEDDTAASLASEIDLTHLTAKKGKPRSKRKAKPKTAAKPKRRMVRLSRLATGKRARASSVDPGAATRSTMELPPVFPSSTGSSSSTAPPVVPVPSPPPSAPASCSTAPPVVPVTSPPPSAPASSSTGPEPKAKVCKGSPWPSWEVAGGGRLVLNSETQSLAMHCRRHGARCRIQQVLHKKPLGYLLAWDEEANSATFDPDGDEGRPAHMGYRLAVLHGERPKRVAARQRGESDPALRPIFQMEARACGFDSVGDVQEP